MDEMRIILTIVGLILLVVIYWMGRRDERRTQEKNLTQGSRCPEEVASIETETRLHDTQDYDRFYMSKADNDIFIKSSVKKVAAYSSSGQSGCSTATVIGDEPVYVSMDEPETQSIELPADIKPMIINLAVMAPQDMMFEANYLKQTLDDSGMKYGDMNIYHYFRRPKVDSLPSRGQRLFSVANMVEPGYFDPQNINTYHTPGIILFLQLPGPIDGVLAFEKMHQMGEMLAKRLNGVLCDDKHNKITPQSITHLKDEISQYNLKLRTKLAQTVH